MKGGAKGATEVSYGDCNIQARKPGWITARRSRPRFAMTRHIKRGGKVWIMSSPTSRSPRSRPKPAWVRARATREVGRRHPPAVMFELSYHDEEIAAWRSACHPEAAREGRFVKREEGFMAKSKTSPISATPIFETRGPQGRAVQPALRVHDWTLELGPHEAGQEGNPGSHRTPGP